jgi:hypothetical protein
MCTFDRRLRSAILIATILLAWPSRSNACSCPSQTAFLAWPKSKSVDVPVDTTLVVLTSAASDLGYSLHDAEGIEVPVQLVRVLDASPGCGYGLQDVVFLRPTSPLHPSTAYRLTLGFATTDAAIPSTTPNSDTEFVTGVGMRVGFPPPAIDRWLFAQLLDDGSRILQVFASATGAEPTFMVTKGAPSTVIVPLGPLAFESPAGVSLGKVDCANVEFVDATGRTSKAEQLCTPERCERPAALTDRTCGLNSGGESWETWQKHEGGCGSSVTAVAPSSGCNLAPAQRPSGLIMVVVFLLTARARRNHVRSRGGP